MSISSRSCMCRSAHSYRRHLSTGREHPPVQTLQRRHGQAQPSAQAASGARILPHNHLSALLAPLAQPLPAQTKPTTSPLGRAAGPRAALCPLAVAVPEAVTHAPARLRPTTNTAGGIVNQRRSLSWRVTQGLHRGGRGEDFNSIADPLMITSSGESFISLLNCQQTSAAKDQSTAFNGSVHLRCQDVSSMPRGGRHTSSPEPGAHSAATRGNTLLC